MKRNKFISFTQREDEYNSDFWNRAENTLDLYTKSNYNAVSHSFCIQNTSQGTQLILTVLLQEK